MLDSLKPVMIPIHKEGWRFIAIFAIVTGILFFFNFNFFGFVGVVLTIWCATFFRNPDRIVPQEEGLIVSPADGVVQMISEEVPPAELGLGDETYTRVSVFMNVFNVHVNRSPIAGTVKTVHYKPGAFLNADLDKASTDNERQSFIVEGKDGVQVVFVQIAGLVARRIMGFVKEGDTLEVGERFGLIRFGSRVDVYLPKGVVPAVALGQTCTSGETILADTKHKDKPAAVGVTI